VRSRAFALLAAATTFGATVFAHAIVTALGFAMQAVSGPLTGGPALYAIFVDGLAGAGIVLWELHRAAGVITRGAECVEAAETARAQAGVLGRPALAVVTLYLVLRVCDEPGMREPLSAGLAAAGAMVGAAAVALFCLIILPLALARMRFGEQMIASANRAREDLERLTATLEFLAQPRWALSLSGSAIVLFAPVFFDHARGPDGHMALAVLEMWNSQVVAFYGTVAGVVVIAWSCLKDWRGALSCTTADVVAATVGAWLSLHTGLVPGFDAPLGDENAVRVWDLVAAGTAVMAGQTFALAAASAETGAAAGTAVALCACLAWLISCAATPGALLPITGIVALVLSRCFRMALDTLFPRYRSVDEVFRRK
jgi:hypothetical protein